MKRFLGLAAVLMMVLGLVGSAQAGSWFYAPGDPASQLNDGMWVEFFVGGGPGQQGNLIFAIDKNVYDPGTGTWDDSLAQWSIGGFTLAAVEYLGGGTGWGGVNDGVAYNQYQTLYINGSLYAADGGPWGEGGHLDEMFAMNWTTSYANGNLDFFFAAGHDTEDVMFDAQFSGILNQNYFTFGPGGFPFPVPEWEFDLSVYSGHWGSGFEFLSLQTPEGEPVPVPAAVWLLGSGLVGLVGFRRRFSN